MPWHWDKRQVKPRKPETPATGRVRRRGVVAIVCNSTLGPLEPCVSVAARARPKNPDCPKETQVTASTYHLWEVIRISQGSRVPQKHLIL